MNSKYKIVEYINQNKIIKYFKKKLKFNKMYYYFINFKYWNIVIIIVWIILYALGYLTIIRIIIFVEICFIIYVYKKMYEFLISQKCIKILKNKSNKFYYYIFKLNKISLLSIVISLELKIYNLIKWYQAYYLNKNNDKKDSLVIILISLLIPFKIFLNVFYKFFYNKQILTLKEIIFKRAFGTILSVLIFTNILQMLIKIFETHINLLVIVYLIFSLKVWYDLKTKNQLELMYLGNFTDTLKIIKIRKNLLSYVVINVWKECIINKETFFFINKKIFYVLNYYVLDIINYDKEQVEIKVTFLNKIKRGKKIKNIKIYLLQKFYGMIFKSMPFLLKPLNDLIYYKTCFYEYYSDINLNQQKKEIEQLIKLHIAQSEILLYIVWDIIILNKIATKKELFNMIIITYEDVEDDDINLKIVWSYKPKDFDLLNESDYFYKLHQLYDLNDNNCLKYLNFNYEDLYLDIYEMYLFYTLPENVFFRDIWKTNLYQKHCYWVYKQFKFKVDGIYIMPIILWDLPYFKKYVNDLQFIKLKLIENYSEFKINEEYIKKKIKILKNYAI